MIRASELVAGVQKSLDEKWGYIWGTSGVMWTEARQKQLEKTTDEDRANSRRYGKKWIGHMVADCSGLIRYWFEKYGSSISHSSHTQYTTYSVRKGTLKNGRRTDGFGLRPGTAVFVYSSSRKRYTHVGIYVGNGIVIEAMGAQHGVTTSAVSASKWTHWGELKDMEYDLPADDGGDTPAPEPSRPTLKRGSKGEAVKELQTLLVNAGYDIGSYGIDGDFGRATESAVKAFQRASGLADDGIVGPATWKALDGQKPAEKRYAVNVPHITQEQAEMLCKTYPGATMTAEV